MTVHTGANILSYLALEKLRHARGKFYDLHSALHFAASIRQDFPMLAGNDRCEISRMPFQDLQEPVQDTGALQRRSFAPSGESAASGTDCLSDIVTSPEQNQAGLFAGRGVVDGSGALAASGDSRAANEMRDRLHRRVF
jgi:hypothetical protein